MRLRLGSPWSSTKSTSSRQQGAKCGSASPTEAEAPCGSHAEDEEQSTTDSSLARAAGAGGENVGEPFVAENAETLVLHMAEVFCQLSAAARSLHLARGVGGQGPATSPPGTSRQNRSPAASRGPAAPGAQVGGIVSEGSSSNGDHSGGSQLGAWLPCSLTLTTEALRLSSVSSASSKEASTDGIRRSRSGGSEQSLCTILLERIVDVAALACPNCGGLGQELHSGRASAGRCTCESPQPGSALRSGQLSKDSVAAADAVTLLSLSERSTIDGTFQNTHDGALHTEADEWFSNSIEVGTFELPPIPLARLPESRKGLPYQEGRFSQYQPDAKTHGGRPFWEYDSSNCHPHQALSAAIPPLPPAACRLPQRTHREMRSHRPSAELSAILESDGPPFPHVIVVWTASSASLAASSGYTRRLQQGTPVLLCFADEDAAAHARDMLLHHRAARLSDWGARTAEAGGVRSAYCLGVA